MRIAKPIKADAKQLRDEVIRAHALVSGVVWKPDSVNESTASMSGDRWQGLRCCSVECERAYRQREENLAVMAEASIEPKAKRHCECGDVVIHVFEERIRGFITDADSGEAAPTPHEGQLVCTSRVGPLNAREGRFADRRARRLQSSDTRKPCRKPIRIVVALRWPWRLPLAA